MAIQPPFYSAAAAGVQPSIKQGKWALWYATGYGITNISSGKAIAAQCTLFPGDSVLADATQQMAMVSESVYHALINSTPAWPGTPDGAPYTLWMSGLWDKSANGPREAHVEFSLYANSNGTDNFDSTPQIYGNQTYPLHDTPGYLFGVKNKSQIDPTQIILVPPQNLSIEAITTPNGPLIGPSSIAQNGYSAGCRALKDLVDAPGMALSGHYNTWLVSVYGYSGPSDYDPFEDPTDSGRSLGEGKPLLSAAVILGVG